MTAPSMNRTQVEIGKLSNEYGQDIILERLMSADLEYKLFTGMCMSNDDDECAKYLIENRERLIPTLVVASFKNEEDVLDTTNRFCKGIHDRHLKGLPLS